MKSKKSNYRKSNRFEKTALFVLQDSSAGGGAMQQIDVAAGLDCVEDTADIQSRASVKSRSPRFRQLAGMQCINRRRRHSESGLF